MKTNRDTKNMETLALEGQWIQWEPLPNLCTKYDVESIIDTTAEFSIYLYTNKDKKKRIKMTFDSLVLSYRKTHESFRIKTINDLNKKYGPHFYGDWTFFKIKNSTYVTWIGKQSYEFAQPEQLVHFVILGSDIIVDIITTQEPKIGLIEKE